MKIVPQDKRYMQSPEFWNTPHNKKNGRNYNEAYPSKRYYKKFCKTAYKKLYSDNSRRTGTDSEERLF